MLLASIASSSSIALILIVLLLIIAGCWIFFKKEKFPGSTQKILTMSEPPRDEFFLPILKHFSDNMNNLWNIVRKETDLENASTTFENIGQIIEGHGSNEFKVWYNSFVKDRNIWNETQYSKKAKVLLDCFEKCGIQPAKEEFIIWDEQSSLRYIKLTSVSMGQKCKVIVPVWIYKGEVFEKGLVKTME